jgi:hypothetical protein
LLSEAMRGYDELFMKLPNGDHAIVEIRKLLEYCLNSQHPRGRNKARVFASFGIREADAEELRGLSSRRPVMPTLRSAPQTSTASAIRVVM